MNICTHMKNRKQNGVTVMNFFSIFFIENELFTEKVKKQVRDNEPNGRKVQPTQLILISVKAGFSALQNNREFFFRKTFQFSSHTFIFA